MTITESFYPPISLGQLISDFGGVLGFWLGVGVLQMGGYIVTLIDKLKDVFKNGY